MSDAARGLAVDLGGTYGGELDGGNKMGAPGKSTVDSRAITALAFADVISWLVRNGLEWAALLSKKS